MTNEEAIELLDNLIGMVEDNQNNDYDEALKSAIKALNKQISKKPLIRYENMGIGISPNENIKIYGCPCCKEEIDGETPFCQNCLQMIDRGEGENE